MPISLDCDICAKVFNDTQRSPKLLPCQHTFCLDCLIHMDANGSITCPMDRKVFHLNAAVDLPDNLYVKAKLENVANDSGSDTPSKRFRGSSDGDPKADADNLQLQLLASLAERLEELVAALRVVRDGVLAALQERFQAEGKLLKRVRDCIECLQGEQQQQQQQQQPSARAQELHREAASLLHAGAALEQDLQLLQPRLASVSAEGGWHSKRVQLSEQPALQLAALQLRQQDSLEWKPSQQEQQQEGNSQQEPQEKQELLVSRRRDVGSLTWSTPREMAQVKQEWLLSTDPLHMLTRVMCNKDPDFSLSLLWKHAAHLEELHLRHAGRSHLLAVQSMRRLRKLQVRIVSDADSLGELPGQQPRGEEDDEEGGGLTWLQLLEVPRDTAWSLIAANGRSLRKLRLGVGPPSKLPARGEDPPAADWPCNCNDLEDFLRDCRLQRLESLTLVRSWPCPYPSWCRTQLSGARRALPPGCRVRCTVCRVWVDETN